MEEYNIEIIRKKYQMVPRTLIFIEKDNEILVLKKSKVDSYGYGKINGVGGHIEKGEEPFEAARREIYEEASIEVSDLDLTAILFIDINANPGIQVFVFKATYKSGFIKESEEGHLEWMLKENLLKSEKIVRDLPFLLEITEKHKNGAAPRIVKYLYNEDGKKRIG